MSPGLTNLYILVKTLFKHYVYVLGVYDILYSVEIKVTLTRFDY